MRRYPDRGLHGRVVEELGFGIVSGSLAPDETIDGEALAAHFDVSRTVMREALRVLAGKGLVDARPRRGTFVRQRSHWNLLDPDVLRWQFAVSDPSAVLEQLHEVRLMVEPASVELAALRRSDADLEALDAALAIMASDESPDVVVEADIAFHRALIAATQNELIGQLATVVDIGLEARDRFVHHNEVSIGDGLEYHRAVVEALRAREPQAARAAMIVLLTHAAEDVRAVVDSGS